VRRILLLDDPSGTTISTADGTRAALPGEAHRFAELAEALTLHTGLPAEVRDEPAGALDPATAVVVHASQLDRLPATATRTAVVDVDRRAVLATLERGDVTAVVEHHQYWKWKTGGPADAAVYLEVSLVPRLRHEVTVTTLDDSRFARVRINGDDLPGLLADVLRAAAG
jgi:hypothetical protein